MSENERELTPEMIKDQRERMGLTQKQFAAGLGVNQATVSRIETYDEARGALKVMLMMMIDNKWLEF